MRSQIYISTDELVFLRVHNSTVQLMILSFMRGWPKWTPPTLASVSMIVAKTIKELSGNYEYS